MLQIDEEAIAWTCNGLQKNCLLESFRYYKKNNSKIQILKLLKDQKILKNQMIHCLEIIEKIYIYIYIWLNNKEI